VLTRRRSPPPVGWLLFIGILAPALGAAPEGASERGEETGPSSVSRCGL